MDRLCRSRRLLCQSAQDSPPVQMPHHASARRCDRADTAEGKRRRQRIKSRRARPSERLHQARSAELQGQQDRHRRRHVQDPTPFRTEEILTNNKMWKQGKRRMKLQLKREQPLRISTSVLDAMNCELTAKVLEILFTVQQRSRKGTSAFRGCCPDRFLIAVQRGLQKC